MRPLTSSAGPALRSWTKYPLPTTRIASSVAVQQRRSATQGEVSHTSSFDSPFRTSEPQPATTKIPSFKKYMSNSPEVSNRVFQYFVVGSMGLLAAAGAKATVQGASKRNWNDVSGGGWLHRGTNADRKLYHRLPSQHVRLSRCACTS
jgi:ubiquinol-cytochrome c reductase iron-sulfur subunit